MSHQLSSFPCYESPTMAEGSTRRLPPWMIKSPESNSVSTENSDSILLPKQSETTAKKQKRNRTIKQQIDEETASDRSHEDSARKSAPRKDKQKARKSRRNSKETNAPSTSSSPAVDDGFDFTVDDLVSIAQEYVKDETGLARDWSPDRRCESQSILPQTADLRDDSNNIPVASGALASCCSHSTASSEQCLIGTGDPARDMLDLFLGPLLNKPIEGDKRYEFDRKESSFVNFRTQSQNDDDRADENVPLVKKKTSLKHKVSLLLD